MLFFRYLLFQAVLISILLFSLTSSFADDVRNENKTHEHKWFLTLYGGPSTQPDLENTLVFNMRFEDDTYIAVAALAREFWRYENWISFEIEGQVGK